MIDNKNNHNLNNQEELVKEAKQYLETLIKVNENKNCLIISFDGTHGTGKSINIKNIANILKNKKYDTLLIRETDEQFAGVNDGVARGYSIARKSYIYDCLIKAIAKAEKGENITPESTGFNSIKLSEMYHTTRIHVWGKYINNFIKKNNNSKKVILLNRSYISGIAMGLIEDPAIKLDTRVKMSCNNEIIPADISFILVGEKEILYNRLAERSREKKRSFKGKKDWINQFYILMYAIKNNRIDSKEDMRKWWLDLSNEKYKITAEAIPRGNIIEVTRLNDIGDYENIGKRNIKDKVKKLLEDYIKL